MPPPNRRHKSRLGERFTDTPQAKLMQFNSRKDERLPLHFFDIEPKSKAAMPPADKQRLQRALLEQMIDLNRRAFDGPLALRLHFETTEKNPGHIHTIAKNLLDLFAKPLPELKSRRKGLLYKDDRQIHALSVSCRHGQAEPSISVRAMRLRNLLDDIELAKEVSFERTSEAMTDHLEDALDEYLDFQKKQATYRKALSDEGFNAMLRMHRMAAQNEVFGRLRVSAWELAQLYRTTPDRFGLGLAAQWDEMFQQSAFRIMLDELPLKEGGSRPYKKAVRKQLDLFKSKLGGLIDPLCVPVGLEIVIKPPPDDRRTVEHDLDNVARDYIIPAAVEVLSPTSDMAFFFGEDEIKSPLRDDPAIYRKPPKTTRLGVMRYEVWRLPAAESGKKGFVGLAVVADPDFGHDLIDQIDADIEQWAEDNVEGISSLDRYRLRRKRRRARTAR